MKSFIILTILIQCLILGSGDKGSSCKVKSTGSKGICIPRSQCSSSRHSSNHHSSPVTYCSRGANPLVCCETSGKTKIHQATKTQTQKPSERECHELYLTRRRRRKKRASRRHANLILGGSITDNGEFPYMAALGWKNPSGGYDYKCGGFLVSPEHVVTAAHCAAASPDVVRVGGGSLDQNDRNPAIGIAKTIVHPSYRSKKSYNDIAILKLTGYAPHSPACLWQSTDINYHDAIAIGYGHTQTGGNTSNVLRKVSLNIYSNSFCTRYYPPDPKLPQGIISSQICAGELKELKDTCPGDSGGPLMVKASSGGRTVPYILGITSFGTVSGGSAPSIYTRISSFVGWIESVVWPQR